MDAMATADCVAMTKQLSSEADLSVKILLPSLAVVNHRRLEVT